ncbi:MAG TPA: tetratricopeptide repeat protein, partial [Gemmatimonadaceae bacterium]|nr:tetratricopeptide repeat protein [Gemmatimonadaceae bacterium]
MLYLQTFGTVNLKRDGELLTGAAQQRRLLAALAVLAVAGPAGVSRDKLLAMFWPESDADKARRALNQLLYHIRKELGDLVIGSAELRLNPELISTDVGDFDSHIGRGTSERAAEAYTGPFLDGFFLTGLAEFEEWTATVRARYAARYVAALDGLAESAKARGDLAGEGIWRRRRVDVDATDAEAVIALMRCLIALGNRVDALNVAKAHEERMRAAFELPADPGVVALAQSLRTTPPEIVVAGLELPPEIHGPAQRLPSRGLFRARRHPVIWASVIASVAVAAYLVVANQVRHGQARQAASLLIVAPFRIAGDSGPGRAYLAEGLLDMLSTRLAAAEAKRAVDAGKVLRAWRSAGLDGPHPGPVSVAAASRVAKSLGGHEVVTGSVAQDGRSILFDAQLLDADRQVVTSRVSVRGSPDSLGTLVDRVVSGLVLGAAGEADRIRTPPSLTPAALHTYVLGRAAYGSGDFQEAIRYFSQAVANDPTFALAALDLAIAADRVSAAEQYDRGLALAWAGRSELSERDSAYLVAFAGSRYPAPSPATEHLAAWKRAVQLDPDHPDAWFELGQSYYYNGEALGIPDADERAEMSVRRALSVDPNFAPAARLLPVILVNRRDVAGLRQLLRRPGATRNWGDLRDYLTWRTALLLGDARALKQVRAQLDGAPIPSLRAIALASQIDGVATADGDRALVLLRLKAATDREILDALLAMHSRAQNAHDLERVRSIMAAIRTTEPAFHVDARLTVLDALYGGGDLAAAARSAAELEGHLASELGSTPADSA